MGYCVRDEEGGYSYFFTQDEVKKVGFDPNNPRLKDLMSLLGTDEETE